MIILLIPFCSLFFYMRAFRVLSLLMLMVPSIKLSSFIRPFLAGFSVCCAISEEVRVRVGTRESETFLYQSYFSSRLDILAHWFIKTFFIMLDLASCQFAYNILNCLIQILYFYGCDISAG